MTIDYEEDVDYEEEWEETEEDEYEGIRYMSLVMALRGRDGIILASDGRALSGPKGQEIDIGPEKKIFRLGPHCAIGIGGDAGIGWTLSKRIMAALSAKGSRLTPNAIDDMGKICKTCYDEYFPRSDKIRRPALVLLIAGYETITENVDMQSISILESPSNFVPRSRQRATFLGTATSVSEYWIKRLYHPQMSLIDLSKLAAYLIIETATFDVHVDETIYIARITREKGYEDLSVAETESIAQEVQRTRDLNVKLDEDLKRMLFSSSSP